MDWMSSSLGEWISYPRVASAHPNGMLPKRLDITTSLSWPEHLRKVHRPNIWSSGFRTRIPENEDSHYRPEPKD